MKRVLLSCLLVAGLSVPSATPSSAIFGLGACEKVKKEILALEKQVDNIYTKSMGTNYEQVAFKQKETIWEPNPKTIKMMNQLVGNDPFPKIWKIATNNPKCFTNTQNMQVVKMKDIDYKNYFIYPATERKFKNTGECKSLMEKTERKYDNNFMPTKATVALDAKCAIGNIVSISLRGKYNSIYNY